MAGGTLSRVSVAFIIFLTFCFILDKENLFKVNGASSVMLALKSDLKHFPRRGKIAGTNRQYSIKTQVPPSLKLLAGVHIFNTSAMALLFMMLAGDINPNPGPSGLNTSKSTGIRGFKIGHLNVRSISNKMDEIRLLLRDNRFEVFAVSETWLSSSISDSEVFISGYTLVRNDRKFKRGGGTAIYVRDGIPFKHRLDLSDEIHETVWIEIMRSKCKKQFICCLYRAEDCSTESLLEDLNTSVNKIPDEAELTILGDFNIDASAKKGSSNFYLRRKLFSLANLHSLEQLIKNPTRISQSSETMIDLIFVNYYHRIVDSGVIQCAISDHALIYCTSKAGVPRAVPKIIEHRTYRNYDKNAFIRDLQEINWNLVFTETSVETAVKCWNDLFTSVANKHAPIKRTRVKGIQTPWLTPDLKQAMRDRDFHHSKAIKTKSTHHWEMYKKLRLYVNKQIRKCKSDYYQDLISKNKGNGSNLWKILNDVTGRKNTTGLTSIVADNVTFTDPKSIAEILNSFFTSIGSTLASKLMPVASISTLLTVPTTVQEPEHQFNFQPVTENFVWNQLRRLKTNKAIGLDNIGARLVKDSSIVICKHLTCLYNRSLQAAEFPSIWKMGKVTALFKSGSRTDTNNYRPITVLPTLSKILEKAVHVQVYGFLNTHKLLTTKQFGFREKLSTAVALTRFTDTILEKMDDGQLTGVAFLDLTKAFDTVNHSRLLSKMKLIGISGHAVEWFKSYLTHRCQVTVNDNNHSSTKPINVGVPQGSILGPLLFIIYVNDLPDCVISCEISMFADDTVIYFSSKSVKSIEEKVNEDMANIHKWFVDNRLTLNAKKSKFMLIGGQQRLKSCSGACIRINEVALEQIDTFKYLGITINRNMTWSDHIESAIGKANQRIGLLKRVKHLLPRHARITLYNALILPILDYADIVWGDKENITLMDMLQKVQNKAAKTILDLPMYASSTDALETLGFKPLGERRFYHRCLLVHKIKNDQIDYQFNFLTNNDVHQYSTRRKNDFRLKKVRTNWGKQTFSYHALNDFNTLPPGIKETDSLAHFKLHFS